jgi:hypothetical protein
MGHAIDHIPPAATNSHQLIRCHQTSIDSVEKDVAQNFNAEQIINGGAGDMYIVLESRAPVHICEQQSWSRGNTGRNGEYV